MEYPRPRFLRRARTSPKLVAGRSAIEGDGVFTTEKIAEGETIMEFGGMLVSRQDAFSGRYRVRSIWPITTSLFLALSASDTEPSLDEYVNHSCDANAWLQGDVVLLAWRDIAAGEEITFDQGTWADDKTWSFEPAFDLEMQCRCGSAHCRHVVTKKDWAIPGVQSRYRGHFHPVIQELIDPAGT
jgi:hypothetical protein